ncbi:MAG: DUF4926 domain-containing protein [Leptospiraceae bacterium]|nr:DUF4926 domain-containing protein [Leptospiraceae bacterium]
MKIPKDAQIHSFKLYNRVSLNRDFTEYKLRKGDVGTLVELVPHPEGKEQGAVLEIFNALGVSLQVVAIPISAIENLKDNEILSVRKLAS